MYGLVDGEVDKVSSRPVYSPMHVYDNSILYVLIKAYTSVHVEAEMTKCTQTWLFLVMCKALCSPVSIGFCLQQVSMCRSVWNVDEFKSSLTEYACVLRRERVYGIGTHVRGRCIGIVPLRFWKDSRYNNARSIWHSFATT